MQCENCKKKTATVHLTEISNQNVKKEVHLCEDCARQKGVPPYNVPYKVQFSLTELFSGLIEPMLGKMIKEMGNIKCPNCNMSYLDFRSKARFGCAKDYEFFKKAIEPLLEKIHGSTQHQGKVPLRTDPWLLEEKEIRQLQRDLERLIKVEEFERAAEVRDKIKALKGKKRPQTKDTRGK